MFFPSIRSCVPEGEFFALLYDAVSPPPTSRLPRQVLCGVVAFLLLTFFLVFVALSAGNRRQVLLFENPAVVQFVSGDNVCQCPYRDFILVRNAAPLPGIAAQP